VPHLAVYFLQAMKRPRRAGKSKARGAGWAAEAFQESDDGDELNQQPRQRPRDLHPHAIVNATPTGAHSSIVNAFTHPPVTKAAQEAFYFMDTLPSQETHAADHNDSFDVDIDTIFQEYGFMDPELSAAWDEDHGLKAKRTRTASVRKSITFCLIFL